MNELATDEWVCDVCSLINKKSKTSCISCHNSKVAWFCNQCMLKNHPEDYVCISCSFQKPANSPALANVRNRTPRNSARRVFRAPFFGHGENAEITVISTWTCKNCRRVNAAASSVNCEQCQRQNKIATGSPYSSPKVLSPVIIRPIRSNSSQLSEDIRQQDEQEALKRWHGIVRSCHIKKQSFQDEAFPPIPRSIFGSREPFGMKKGIRHRWLRPHEICVNGDVGLAWSVFNNPHPSDITQGTCRNYYWLTDALSVVAEHESLLKKIIITHEYCAEGAYLVRLCKDGSWVVVVVDDMFPCNKKRRLIFSRAKMKQLWVPLIEKAAAKLYGSYKANSRTVVEGFTLLTGQPCESLSLCEVPENGKTRFNKEQTWAQLITSIREKNFLVSAKCGVQNLTKEEYEVVGLQYNHLYSVVDVQLCQGNRLLKMRDPREKTSCEGAWSAMSNTRSNDLQALTDPEKLSSGEFWIPFDDLLKYFEEIFICRTRDSWNEVRLNYNPVTLCEHPKSTCFMLEVFRSAEMELSFFQKRPNGLSNKSAEDNFSTEIFIFSTGNESSNRIGKVVAYEKTRTYDVVNLRIMLESGKYILVRFLLGSKPSEENSPNCMMALYSPQQFLVEEIRAPKFFQTDLLVNTTLCPAIPNKLKCSEVISRQSSKLNLDQNRNIIS